MTGAQRPRVLIVDDDERLRRTFARVIATRFEVSVAENGAVAVALLEKETFDAVLTDLEMPELGGDGVVAWLEQNRPHLARRVIVVTGGAKRADQSAWLDAFDERRVIQKPCAVEDVLAAIERVLAGASS